MAIVVPIGYIKVADIALFGGRLQISRYRRYFRYWTLVAVVVIEIFNKNTPRWDRGASSKFFMVHIGVFTTSRLQRSAGIGLKPLLLDCVLSE